MSETVEPKKRSRKEKNREYFLRFVRVVTQNISLPDMVLYGAVAYLGWQAMKGWQGAITGIVALKLATSPGGAPPIVKTAGLMILAGIGLKFLAGGLLTEDLGNMLAEAAGIPPDRLDEIRDRILEQLGGGLP